MHFLSIVCSLPVKLEASCLFISSQIFVYFLSNGKSAICLLPLSFLFTFCKTGSQLFVYFQSDVCLLPV